MPRMKGTPSARDADLLRNRGLKATPRRLRLMEALAQAKRPMSVGEIEAAGAAGTASTVTLYRALEALAAAGIVRRVDLRHGHADYELVISGDHHHHLVCTGCGALESFSDDLCNSLAERLVKQSTGFKTVTAHSMEFFGRCVRCS